MSTDKEMKYIKANITKKNQKNNNFLYRLIT